MNIYKEITGQGKDIVILHGWGGCNHKHMQPIVDELFSRYRISNFDLPGAGQSDWSSDIQTMHDIADQLLAELPKQAIYIGASFGGLVAMSIAARYPKSVSQLIGITTTPKFVTSDYWPGIPQPGFKSPFSQGITKTGLNAFTKAWIDSEFVAFNPKPKAYSHLLELLDQDSPNVNLDVLFKGIDIVDSTDLRNAFKSIQCPIDLIFGGEDDAIPITALENIKGLNPHSHIHIIPGARHIPYWTHLEEFNKTLNRIL